MKKHNTKDRLYISKHIGYLLIISLPKYDTEDLSIISKHSGYFVMVSCDKLAPQYNSISTTSSPFSYDNCFNAILIAVLPQSFCVSVVLRFQLVILL